MPAASTRLEAGHRHAVARNPMHLLGVILGGSVLMALAAHVAVPFWPVPLTLQSLVVLGLGAAFGPGPAAGAVLAWIAEGALGLPVFAAGGGVAMLMGPTAGYIVGFLPAALIAGLTTRSARRRHPLAVVALFVAADAALFACGVGWLASLMGPSKAVAVGLTPFLLGEALKIGLAAAAVAAVPARWAQRT